MNGNPEPKLPGPIRALASLLQDLPALAAGMLELLSLELEHMRALLARMALLAALALVTALTAWLALWTALVQGLLALGWPLPLPWLLVLVLNVGLLLWLSRRLRGLAGELGLPASYRQLRGCLGVDVPSPPNGHDADPGAPRSSPP